MIRFALILLGFFLFSNVNALELSPRAFLGSASYTLEIDIDSTTELESSHPVLGVGLTFFKRDWNFDLLYQSSLSATFKGDDYEDDFSQSNAVLTMGKRLKQAVLYFGVKTGNSTFTYDPSQNTGIREMSLDHALLFLGGNYAFPIGRAATINIGLSLGGGSGTIEFKNVALRSATADGTGAVGGANLNLGFSSFINPNAGFTIQFSYQTLQYSKFEEDGETLDLELSETTGTLTAQAFLYF